MKLLNRKPIVFLREDGKKLILKRRKIKLRGNYANLPYIHIDGQKWEWVRVKVTVIETDNMLTIDNQWDEADKKTATEEEEYGN